MDKAKALKALTCIPGVGKSVALDFWSIGIKNVSDLRGKNAEELYTLLNKVSGFTQNKCFLYVFRCAIYYAETPPEIHDKEKLNWWYWKEHY